MLDETESCECEPGTPAWVTTFADLMSLLMCFFVLLLAFSEMDALKFKQIAGSMRMAFGVQREVEAVEIPKGTSVIAQEFSPSISEPTPLNIIRQDSTDDRKTNLDFTEGALEEARKKEMEADATEIKEALAEEIAAGMVTVETEGGKIIIRIQEKGSFPSGSSDLKPGFSGVIDRLTEVLKDGDDEIVVAGHTDNIPISTSRFRSNWELSSARAVTVAHELLRSGQIKKERLLVEGHADTDPLMPNDSWENRAKNRRVEIILIRGANEKQASVQAPGVGE